MTFIPGNYKLIVPQRATLEEGPIWLPFNGTGLTFYSSVWTSDKRTTKLFDLDVIVDAAVIIGDDPENPLSEECKIRLRADWDVTRTATKNGYWDLLAVWPSGDRQYCLEGLAVVNFNVTEAPP